MSNNTQNNPKFQYRFRFLALCATGRAIIHITATDEHAAREMSPVGFVMVFAARLPVGANRNQAEADRFIPDLVAIASEREDIICEMMEGRDVLPVREVHHV
ncbi:host cell division inhibitor Icd-like protein [Rahnella sp. CJA17(1/100)]|uniref:host cell division inhibitor Icd-like protein n=1 Tax=Rahnella sp. CJA17(1/100) TaxID=2508951 RepID=UPI001F0F1E11|nr:host cell division inhibitor Icd-like protein [Rahnella sp. CJA17(1/100)]